MLRYGFIAAGNIIRCMHRGAEMNEDYNPAEIGIYDINEEVRKDYAARGYKTFDSMKELIDNSEMLVLANEEVVNGVCERCGSEVIRKNQSQWMLKITKYADRLLEDLDRLEWPEKVKKMQTDWIGRSYGAEVDFAVEGHDKKVTVYTTRPDTLYGATFMVLAPEHEMAKELATDETREAVEDYIFKASMKSSVDRLQDKEKTGVFTGSYAINPLNNEKIPIWLSDYVLADYGTGAIMCVPAHDDRDFEFAKKFDIPVIQVIAKDGKEIENMTEAYTEASGTMINSGDWNGMESSVLKKEAPAMIEKMGFGRKTVNYKLRDWVFSRQRYWGEPIPIVHCEKCGAVPVPEEELPLLLVMLPLLLVVFVMFVMLVRLSWSISYMGSAWPSWSSVAALRARAALVVSPVMLWILGVNMVNIHMILPADRTIEIV